MNRSVVIAAALLILANSVGCSMLGFPTPPAASTMMDQSKQVLNASPRHPLGVPRELDKQVLKTHYLQPGDELLIELNDISSTFRLPADQQVSADGTVDLGKYGRVKVVSLTLEQAEELIEATIAKMEQTPASVNVRLIQSVQRYYVVGEVNSPGSYPLTGYETVLDGIVAAGGLSVRASACDMLLARPTDPCSCRVTLPICYRAMTQLGDTTTNYQLKPGDRIFVGRQTLLEELKQCCGHGKKCDRCRKQQRACGDPAIIDSDKTPFARASSSSIQAALSTELPMDFASPGRTEVRVEELESLQAEPATPQEQGMPPLLDGELDFGETFRQP